MFRLNNTDFQKLSEFINTYSGIKMPPTKKTLLESRLQRRIKELNVTSFEEYCNIVFSSNQKSTEVIKLIDRVCTNKTSFFREIGHFEYLQKHILPEMIDSNKKLMKIWSAGCSSGEEPYSIAIAINEFRRSNEFIDYQILGSDLSTTILKQAKNAIYHESKIEDLPIEIKRRYFLKGKGEYKGVVRVKPEISKKVMYQRINFMDNEYPINESFDLAFCRNVLIYFDRETQEKVIKKICKKIKIGGYFFLGHSESTMGMQLPLKQLSPTIYQRI